MCALRINDAVTNVLRPQAEKRFPSLEQRAFTIAHCTGSTAGTPYHSYVTEAAYKLLHHSTKLGGSPKRDLWEAVTLTLGREEWSCYRSRWWTR